MDPKEWFNLRQIYRARLSAASSKMDSKITLACLKQGVRMCCGRVGGVVGVVGVTLTLLGMTQLVAGVYFMLVLPIFQLGSNIWTGTWSGMCGLVLAAIGWKKQTMKRGQVVLIATLSVLVANVANLVILQVGENGVFLTNDDVQTIMKHNQENYLRIALWLTTAVTALVIVVSFIGAQYLFCVVVRGPKVKGRMPITRSLSEEDLHHRQVETTRFQSPCLTSISTVACDDLTLRTVNGSSGPGVVGGDGENIMHGFPGDGSCRSSSNGVCVVNGGGGETVNNQEPTQNKNAKYTRPQDPKTPENSVPYFLRNHRSAWQFILPEVVKELRESNRFSETFNDVQSRTSTLSRVSKSSFQPFRTDNIQTELEQSNVLRAEHQLNGLHRVSRAPSSCNTSMYSLPESCRQNSTSPRPGGRVRRPSVPPPSPPPTGSSANLRSLTTGGWESCAIIQYPQQAGGGFVVDLD